ncbi:GTPase Era [Haliovirga abyssi]|uniref:GTPase Era n=1 Tax=Haliovirga abyssi TaxID=2996794 RepID=A0AAU9DCT0_9FUSO|nr:GTPase Era [Haliovirga abyssi]BDU50102.1 GTPase Era [Haliovirga abyssi]
MRSGFIALVGRPNVGKSTLMNWIVKEKVAIVSSKAQTTRDRIKGILTKTDTQYIFVDTPGIHKPQHLLGEYMTKTAIDTLKEVDLIVMVIDGKAEIGKGDKFVRERIEEAGGTPRVAVINKIDDLTDEDIEKKKIEIKEKLGKFNEIYTISGEYGINVDEFLKGIKKYLEDGVMYYPEDMYTDMPMYKVITEIVREKILWNTREEIPHSVAIEITDVKRRENGKDCYNINIYVERDSQKGIIIGNKGKMLKKIGIEARKDIEQVLERGIYLNLWVKVKDKWRKKKPFLKEMGYIIE